LGRFLDVLNVETEDGTTGADLRKVLFGEGFLPFVVWQSGAPRQIGSQERRAGWRFSVGDKRMPVSS